MSSVASFGLLWCSFVGCGGGGLVWYSVSVFCGPLWPAVVRFGLCLVTFGSSLVCVRLLGFVFVVTLWSTFAIFWSLWSSSGTTGRQNGLFGWCRPSGIFNPFLPSSAEDGLTMAVVVRGRLCGGVGGWLREERREIQHCTGLVRHHLYNIKKRDIVLLYNNV